MEWRGGTPSFSSIHFPHTLLRPGRKKEGVWPGAQQPCSNLEKCFEVQRIPPPRRPTTSLSGQNRSRSAAMTEELRTWPLAAVPTQALRCTALCCCAVLGTGFRQHPLPPKPGAPGQSHFAGSHARTEHLVRPKARSAPAPQQRYLAGYYKRLHTLSADNLPYSDAGPDVLTLVVHPNGP